jgi:hypothetical protein
LKGQNTLQGLQKGVSQFASLAAIAQVNIHQKGS